MKEKKSLKICQLGMKRVPSREGGIEIVVEELATGMAARGMDVTCCNRSGHHVSGKEFDSQKLKSYKGIKLVWLPTVNAKGLAAASSSFFGAIYAALGNFDVVHFHAEGPCAMMGITKLFGKKCVATIHGLDHQRSKWGKFAGWYIMQGEKAAVKYADEIIVLSKSVQQYFMDTYGRETKLIPNGVNRPVIRQAQIIKDKFGIGKDEYILFLGRIVPEKGVHYLIEAFKNVKTKKKLVIAGGSSDTAEYYDKIQQSAKDDDRIIFTGFVCGNELDELYSNAYIYTLPSDLEGMPLSLLEAMSYGNCCLTSDIPECADVVENKAVTFNKSDVKDLTAKLQYLCDNGDEVNKYKSQSADYICNKYNWNDVVDETLELYGLKKENEKVLEKVK
ncbi:MAG: glycosyltransferase family 4 protein [Clostridia bacterium]|nr:glycosyltransferase family 4 protein [Clostridia bacterium]